MPTTLATMVSVPEFITEAFSDDATIGVSQSLTRLVFGLLLGCVVAGIFRLARGPDADRRLMATLVLLTLLISITTIVIGNNVARAFSIVGALSIVRFRTIVQDTRDTAFVICAVAMGLAVGAGYLVVPLMALPLIAIAAKLFDSPAEEGGSDSAVSFSLNVRVVPGFMNRDELQRLLDEFEMSPRLMAIEQARAGTEVKRNYQIELTEPDTVDRIIDRISSIDGVVGVELTRRRG